MTEKFKASVTQFGDDAFLVRVRSQQLKIKLSEYILSLSEFLMKTEESWVDIVSAEDSFAVKFNPFDISAKNAQKKLEEIISAFNFEESKQRHSLINIPVCYSKEFAPDLEMIAQEKSLTVNRVIEKHTSVTYEVIMIGFTPGFAYLGDLPQGLLMPRRSVPRLYLPPGSIGITGNRTGIYPLGGPGGWQIIGCSPMPLFEPHLENPFKLFTGMRVKFVAITACQFQEYQTLNKQ
jgi:inhibitor of KinA